MYVYQKFGLNWNINMGDMAKSPFFLLVVIVVVVLLQFEFPYLKNCKRCTMQLCAYVFKECKQPCKQKQISQYIALLHMTG